MFLVMMHVHCMLISFENSNNIHKLDTQTKFPWKPIFDHIQKQRELINILPYIFLFSGTKVI